MKRSVLCILAGLMLYAMSPVSAQVDFREESIYFLMTTRFFDGDPSNNAPTEWSSYNPDPNLNPSITDPQDVTWKGDFKGLIQKLDYIQDLGFTAIWITPIVQNRGPLDYHGYHAWDFTKVDPRLESPGATFQDLINEVHARGMKIVLDVVTNHSGRFGIKDVAEIKYNTDPTQPWGQDLNGNPLQDNPSWEYDGLTPNPDDNKIWSRANLAKMPAPYNQNLAAFQWPGKESYVDTSDPDWYHHSGNGFAQGFDDTENLHNRALAGDTPDLNTGSQVVRDYLVAAYTTFINMGVDGFRWDTMKHMSKEDVLYFYDRFKEANPDLFIFGEVAQLRHELHNLEEINPHYYTWRGDVNNSANSGIAVIDFFAQATFHGVFEEGQNFSGVTAASRYDHLYSDPSTLLTWLDNHDFGPNNDWNRRYGGTTENLAAAMNFMFTWRGIPIVYYGTENRFMAGEFADIHNAAGIEQSIDLTGRAYYGAEFDNSPNHVIYQHIKKLNAMRKAIPALQKGSWRWDGNGGGNGVGYVRVHGDSEVAVGLAKDGAVTFNFSGLTNGIYRDVVTGNEISVNNGAIGFAVEPGSAGIYVLNGPGMIGGNGVGFFQAGSGGPVPVVDISPSSGVYPDPIQVSMSVTSQNNPTTIYFTTDGSNPSTSSDVYSGSFTISSTATVKAMARDINGVQSATVTRDYIIGEADIMSIYFEKPSEWTSANIHHWNASPGGIVANSIWPGPSMSNEGDGWYRYDFAGILSTNIVFNDNGSAQSEDFFRTGTGWYDINGVWHITDPRAPMNNPPTTSINPSGGNFVEGTVITVTLSASDDTDPNPSIFYTLDGTNPTQASNVYSGDFDITSTTTVRAASFDDIDQSSSIESETYTFNPPSSDLVVHFKPDGYANPKIYFWSVIPSGVTTTWPGNDMESEGDGWYKYTFVGGECANIIFSNNGGSQTTDLNRCSEGWYVDGQWYDSKPEPLGGLTIHFLKPTSWGTARMHYWNVTPSGIAGTAWPGVQMQNDNNGWWSYTMEGAECASIVFNDNGGSQTTDLSRCSEGWYDNGWSSSARVGKGPQFFEETFTYTLGQAYPNPSSNLATIDFAVPQNQKIRIALFNVQGQLITNLTDKEFVRGNHSLSIDASALPEGIYFYRAFSTQGMISKRLVIRR